MSKKYAPNIMIAIQSSQDFEESREDHMFRVEGILREKNKEKWIQFDEPMGKEKIQTVYRLGKDTVKVIRRGVVSMNHVFHRKTKTKSDYVSPFGVMFLETEVELLEITDMGLRIRYRQYVNDEYTSTNTLVAEWSYIQ